MRRPWILPLLAVTAPPLVLAAAGVVHPAHLTAGSAHLWRDLHVALLPIFPLLGIAPWLVLRRESALLGWIGAVLGYTYAVFYTALDTLAGIGAGAAVQAGLTTARPVLDANADNLARYGVLAYLVAAALAAATALWYRPGPRTATGGILVVAGAWSFLDSHIFWPRGVLTMLTLAIGWGIVILAPPARSSPATGQPGRIPSLG